MLQFYVTPRSYLNHTKALELTVSLWLHGQMGCKVPILQNLILKGWEPQRPTLKNFATFSCFINHLPQIKEASLIPASL